MARTAVARALLDDGLTVVGVDIDGDRPEEAAQELDEAGAFTTIQADLTDPDEAKRLFDEVARRSDGHDALVNNAGMGYATDFVNISSNGAYNFDVLDPRTTAPARPPSRT